MQNKNLIINILILIFLFSLLFHQNVFAEDSLRFGVPAKRVALSKLESWQPVIDEVSKRSGLEIELVITKDHYELIEKMKNEEIDLAYYSPVFYVKAHQELDCIPLVLRVMYGTPYYRAGFITQKDSDINKLEDLRDKNFALTSKRDSTSGYYIPIDMLRDIDIDHQEDLNIIYTGKHENVLRSVSYGLVDAGVIKLFILEDPINQKYLSDIKIFAHSLYLPASSIAARKGLSLNEMDKITTAFLSLNTDSAGRQAMSGLDFDGFVLSDDKLYDIVRDYMSSFDLID
ncbi:phosphate/phosphite/phosphonate ABC transporter substrate-binding protein [Halanaerobium hydrogeniformans]|uniref:Phosphonate ABC transporter, periplasmic phosphonate-binding protein n=1 Tax=Halanaerobium hydrogeniformans TaxID=656519 RepID=E4RKM3_HALHG|nr:phosphate/phosphite/phosphonate ABC transporter substrate-binding protein [Halanaerobium hydrogeniformans]ADQ15670.1 phosphonate ABC transporter, periplasmic phosphonate-binding protein [Halanaerobium hydrogeniformans]